MSTVLHRTTLELIESVHTPDYPTETWVINPDLAAVSGVDSKYWKLTGDVVSEMSLGEKDTVDTADLPDYKAVKCAEIDVRTEELIAEGFVYATKTFSLSEQAQDKLAFYFNARSDVSVTYPIVLNNIDDTDVYSVADAATLEDLFCTAMCEIRSHIDSGTGLKNAVRAAADLSEVDAVTDSR